MDFRHLIVTCLFSMLRLSFETQKIKENYAIFSRKRHRVINYDKEGRYIPICTKHVFFKYYTQEGPSLFFWGETDRRDYAEALNEKISPYYKQDNNDTTIPNLTNGNYDTEESDF